MLSSTEVNPSNEKHEIKFASVDNFYLESDKFGSSNVKNAALAQSSNNKAIYAMAMHACKGCDDRKKTFKDKYMYVSLNSYSGCSISLNIKTVSSRQDANKLALRLYQERRRTYNTEATEKLNASDPYV